jgi:glutamate 5-kinase
LNRKSLLTVGITNIAGSFSVGEVVQLINESGNILGVAKVKLGAKEMSEQISKKMLLGHMRMILCCFNIGKTWSQYY